VATPYVVRAERGDRRNRTTLVRHVRGFGLAERHMTALAREGWSVRIERDWNRNEERNAYERTTECDGRRGR